MCHDNGDYVIHNACSVVLVFCWGGVNFFGFFVFLVLHPLSGDGYSGLSVNPVSIAQTGESY